MPTRQHNAVILVQPTKPNRTSSSFLHTLSAAPPFSAGLHDKRKPPCRGSIAQPCQLPARLLLCSDFRSCPLEGKPTPHAPYACLPLKTRVCNFANK